MRAVSTSTEGDGFWTHVPRDIVYDQASWQPLILDRQRPDDRETLANLIAQGRVWRVCDTIQNQLRDLAAARMPDRDLSTREQADGVRRLLGDVAEEDYGRWVYYPWSGRLVHLLPPEEFRELRLDRNRNKITREEQAQLARLTVGIVGLSVGNAVALTLALEAACGCLKLADFDRLDLSNMNRVRAGVHDIGLPKTALVARQIYEMDPYARLLLFSEGLTEENLDAFLSGEPRVNLLIDECDGLDMKLRMRERARALRLPVLMETSDRGMLDVERFDLEPERPLFHGLVGPMDPASLRGLTTEEKVPIVLSIIGADTMSARMGASLAEVDTTISTWPQLGSDVTLGGASTAAAVRRIGLRQPLPSGRRYVDLEAILSPDSPGDGTSAAGQDPGHDPACHSGPVIGDGLSARLPDLIRFVLERAILAPSGGNCQPWRFHVEGETVWAVHDRQRSRNLLDIGHRASHLALGAAIENVAIAAAHRGYRTLIEPFPHNEDAAVVARLQFAPGAGPEEARLAARFEQIGQRATNRRLGERIPLFAQELTPLQEAASEPGVALHLRTAEAELEEAGRILGAGDRIRFVCSELQREAICEIRWTQEQAERTCDGIDIVSLELSAKDAAALRLLARPDVGALLRQQNGGLAIEEGARKSIAAASAVGLITVDSHDPAAFIRGGRAVQRVWLTATALGLAFQPMTALLYMFEMLRGETALVFNDRERGTLQTLETRLERLFGGLPQGPRIMLFRLARAPEPTARALRLPLDRVLVLGPPR
jgi:nitroreductase/molybdopterin/thiamine biosynthesis adenylyltransferase